MQSYSQAECWEKKKITTNENFSPGEVTPMK